MPSSTRHSHGLGAGAGIEGYKQQRWYKRAAPCQARPPSPPSSPGRGRVLVGLSSDISAPFPSPGRWAGSPDGAVPAPTSHPTTHDGAETWHVSPALLLRLSHRQPPRRLSWHGQAEAVLRTHAGAGTTTPRRRPHQHGHATPADAQQTPDGPQPAATSAAAAAAGAAAGNSSPSASHGHGQQDGGTLGPTCSPRIPIRRDRTGGKLLHRSSEGLLGFVFSLPSS